MTKYQRGELMEGWNDCPLPVPTSNHGASSSSASSKARKRMSRLPVVGVSPSSNESTISGSSRSSMMSSMPPIPSATPVPVPVRGVPKPEVVEVHTEEETVDFSASEAKLRALVEAAPISAKERDFFSKRLVDAFPALEAQHKKFISQIVDGVEAKELSGGLKTQVLNYMMVNSGVSTWGVPLKKLVETFK